MRYLKMELVVLAVLVTVGLVFSLGGTLVAKQDTDQGYEVLSADLEPFRTAFNQASGHVRAVLLVGPT